MAPRAAVVALALTAGAGLAACGGSGGKLSRSELAAKVDSSCKTERAQTLAVKTPKNLLTDASAAAAYYAKIGASIQKQTDDLTALKPADAVKDDFNALIDKQTVADNLIKTIRDKARAHDASGIKDLKKFPATDHAIDLAARKLGATGCG